MVKVSIITPVYNSEEYIDKCLKSLVNQTLDNIEIIIIDDCSTDNSRKIIQDYVERYGGKIIAIYLEKNKGQGYARNIGIEISKGDYIIFVDSDDYIAFETCEIIYRKSLEKSHDIVCFNLVEIKNGIESEKKLEYDSSIDGDIDFLLRSRLVNAKGYFWTRAYKRTLLIENNIKFPVNIHYEDSAFNTLTLLYAKSVTKIDKPLYFYTIRKNSSSNCYNQERLYDRINVTEFMLSETIRRNIYKRYLEIINNKYLKMHIGNIHLCLDMFDDVNIEKLKEISTYVNNNLNYRSLKEYKKLDRVSKLYLLINDLSPKYVIIIDKLYKKILKIINS